MASKAARKKLRLEQEWQRLNSLEARGIAHTHCSDVTLAELDVLLAQTNELLGRIGTHAARARATCPQVPPAYELRATIEEIAAAAASGHAKLAGTRYPRPEMRSIETRSTECERGDSNPHAVKHRNLNPACLPVPPRSHRETYSTRAAAVDGELCGVRAG